MNGSFCAALIGACVLGIGFLNHFPIPLTLTLALTACAVMYGLIDD